MLDAAREHHELLAAEPGQNILGADDLLHLRRDDTEDEVTRLVPVGIVDALEVVEIEQDQAEARRVTVRVGDLRDEPLSRVLSVVQPGQPVA